jgi:ribosomal protein S6--L-glutamate ligase
LPLSTSLKVAILSCNAGAYSTRRLREACVQRGHRPKVLNTLRFSLLVESGRPELYFRNRRLSHYDAAIPRIGASITMFGTAVVRQLEQMGVFSLNSSQAIGVSRDKLRSIQLLSRHDVGIPPTAFARDRDSVLPAIEQVGGPPVVIKLLEGSQGIGVILAETTKIAEAIIQTLHSARQNVVVQKFVHESRGRDLRVLVVGDRVVAAMSRRAAGGDFRANVHCGGRTEPVKLEPAYERTAIRAAQVLGLRVAGVDLLESDSGPQLIEVNSSPGLQGIEAASGVDVAQAIVEHLESEVEFPEVDLRQRLTLKSGYGVVELVVAPDSGLAGRTLGELRLRDREIQLLSVTRDGAMSPNPRGDQRLSPGDTLLCFGNLTAIKALMPKRAD